MHQEYTEFIHENLTNKMKSKESIYPLDVLFCLVSLVALKV